jgi:hypothetical protein
MSIGSNVEENNEEEIAHQMPKEVDMDGMDQDPQPSPLEQEEAYNKNAFK